MLITESATILGGKVKVGVKEVNFQGHVTTHNTVHITLHADEVYLNFVLQGDHCDANVLTAAWFLG